MTAYTVSPPLLPRTQGLGEIILLSPHRKLYKEKKHSSKWKHSRKVTRRNMSVHKHKLRQVTRSEISFSGHGEEEVEKEEEPMVDTAHSVNAENELHEGHTKLLTTV